MKTNKLTPTQIKLKKVLKPIVESIIREGRSELVPYVVFGNYISFTAKRRMEARMAWPKNLGVPNLAKLQKFRQDFNNSMKPGGANEHLAATNSPLSRVWVIDQRTGKEIARYNPPPFEIE